MVEGRVMSRLRFYAEYERDVADWYRHGDGRSTLDGGRGYSFPHCIHGTSRHTDYDNICGGCEDGDGYWNYARELDAAYRDATWAQKQATRRSQSVLRFFGEVDVHSLPDDVRSGLLDWVTEPTSKF